MSLFGTQQSTTGSTMFNSAQKTSAGALFGNMGQSQSTQPTGGGNTLFSNTTQPTQSTTQSLAGTLFGTQAATQAPAATTTGTGSLFGMQTPQKPSTGTMGNTSNVGSLFGAPVKPITGTGLGMPGTTTTTGIGGLNLGLGMGSKVGTGTGTTTGGLFGTTTVTTQQQASLPLFGGAAMMNVPQAPDGLFQSSFIPQNVISYEQVAEKQRLIQAIMGNYIDIQVIKRELSS